MREGLVALRCGGSTEVDADARDRVERGDRQRPLRRASDRVRVISAGNVVRAPWRRTVRRTVKRTHMRQSFFGPAVAPGYLDSPHLTVFDLQRPPRPVPPAKVQYAHCHSLENTGIVLCLTLSHDDCVHISVILLQTSRLPSPVTLESATG